MNLEIRFASPADAELVYMFICRLADYEREPDAVCATPESLRRQLAETHPPFECLLAFESDKPQGFALFFHNFSTWRGVPGLYLEDLFVFPEARGTGIGKQLLKRLAQVAIERGCARMEWIVLDWNTPAINFYRSLGAAALDGWTVFRLSDQPLRRLADD